MCAESGGLHQTCITSNEDVPVPCVPQSPAVQAPTHPPTHPPPGVTTS
jgi:hypothetical protein